VQLAADFDYNRITQTSDRFDPDSKVVRSSQSREESNGSDGKEAQVTVNNELPGAQQQQPTPSSKDTSKKTEEIVNYEISRTTKTEVIEAGRVNRISVAVLVDGVYSKNEKGENVYQPRAKDDLDRIATLVRSAIGFDGKRGDQVEVINLRFADAPLELPMAEPTTWLGKLQFTKDDIMYVIELGVMAFLGLIVLFMVIRPLVRRVLSPESLVAAAIAAPAAAIAAPATGTAVAVPGSAIPSMIDVAQVQGQVHAQSVHRVGELADKNPNETVSIIRQWLSEPEAATH
jgi:flagellar M-ring protein FliF